MMQSLILGLVAVGAVLIPAKSAPAFPLEAQDYGELPAPGLPIEDDNSLEDLEEYLTLLLEDTSQSPPLVYVGPEPTSELQDSAALGLAKRSRYYRRYPWKRQQSKLYDPEAYLCAPTRDDVYQLLKALHAARSGVEQTVNFCNRRRPAKAVFTNIRFLGRR